MVTKRRHREIRESREFSVGTHLLCVCVFVSGYNFQYKAMAICFRVPSNNFLLLWHTLRVFSIGSPLSVLIIIIVCATYEFSSTKAIFCCVPLATSDIGAHVCSIIPDLWGEREGRNGLFIQPRIATKQQWGDVYRKQNRNYYIESLASQYVWRSGGDVLCCSGIAHCLYIAEIVHTHIFLFLLYIRAKTTYTHTKASTCRHQTLDEFSYFLFLLTRTPFTWTQGELNRTHTSSQAHVNECVRTESMCACVRLMCAYVCPRHDVLSLSIRSGTKWIHIWIRSVCAKFYRAVVHRNPPNFEQKGSKTSNFPRIILDPIKVYTSTCTYIARIYNFVALITHTSKYTHVRYCRYKDIKRGHRYTYEAHTYVV